MREMTTIVLKSGVDFTDLDTLLLALAERGLGSYRPSQADVDCDTLEFTLDGDKIVYVIYDWKWNETNN